MSRTNLFPLALTALVALAPEGRAQAQDPAAAVQKMIELNRKALSSFAGKDFDAAKSALMDAVVLGKDAGLAEDKMMARTYLHLGVVYVDGFKDRAKGLRYLGLALRIRPDIPMTPSLATASVSRAFEEARRDPEAAASGAAADPPAKSAPSTAATSAAKANAPSMAAASTPARAGEGDIAGDEPDLPASFPTPLYCPNPDEAPPGEAIALRCVASPTVGVTKMVLYYRLPGGEQFSQVPMARSPRGWFSGTIPAEAATGKSLQYYFEGRDTSGKEVANNGQNDSPNLMMIRAGAPVVGRGPLAGVRIDSGAASARDEENPLEVQENERVRAINDFSRYRRGRGSIFVGVSFGSGYGYHPASILEYNTKRQVQAGLASVGLVHVAPEIGYRITDALSISVMGRFQYIPPEGATPRNGAPARGASSVLAKLAYAFGAKSAQFVVSLAAGGGEGFRLQIPPKPNKDPAISLPQNDTLKSGPFIVCPGLGFVYHFIPMFGWSFEGRGLVPLPTNGYYAAEFSTGPFVSF